MSLVVNFDDIPDDEEYNFELVEKPDYFQGVDILVRCEWLPGNRLFLV